MNDRRECWIDWNGLKEVFGGDDLDRIEQAKKSAQENQAADEVLKGLDIAAEVIRDQQQEGGDRDRSDQIATARRTDSDGTDAD
jgi:hypothetical protein